MNTQEMKRALRQEMRKRKEAFMASTKTEDRLHFSYSLLQKMASTEAFSNATTVLAYYSLDDELDTHLFLHNMAAQKRIILPKVSGNSLTLHPFRNETDLKVGAYGIMEPQTPPISDYGTVDLVIVPGMAFDSIGNRLGRGRGYYDRLFSHLLRPDVIKIGVCYPFQMVEKVPCATFDIRMNVVYAYV